MARVLLYVHVCNVFENQKNKIKIKIITRMHVFLFVSEEVIEV